MAADTLAASFLATTSKTPLTSGDASQGARSPLSSHSRAPHQRSANSVRTSGRRAVGDEESASPMVRPDPDKWAMALAVCAIQASEGLRPVGQLQRWVTAQILDAVEQRARTAERLRRGRAVTNTSVFARSARAFEAAPGVVEAAVVVVQGQRTRAVSVRLEWRHKRWLATHLMFL